MIVGIGTDIVEISRLAKSLKNIKQRCFSSAEITYCDKFLDPLPHYAARWAAKEAFAKALGTGFGANCAWLELEVLNDEVGKPSMQITGMAKQTFEKNGGKKLHLSVSHEKEYAIAFVIIED